VAVEWSSPDEVPVLAQEHGLQVGRHGELLAPKVPRVAGVDPHVSIVDRRVVDRHVERPVLDRGPADAPVLVEPLTRRNGTDPEQRPSGTPSESARDHRGAWRAGKTTWHVEETNAAEGRLVERVWQMAMSALAMNPLWSAMGPLAKWPPTHSRSTPSRLRHRSNRCGRRLLVGVPLAVGSRPSRGRLSTSPPEPRPTWRL
jgi:hypothetical protein